MSIVSEIDSHIKQEGSPYGDWYVGITNDKERRLHGEHNVPKENHWWITREAPDNETARNIEEHFINLGCDGGPGGGDSDSCLVYAYKKTRITNP